MNKLIVLFSVSFLVGGCAALLNQPVNPDDPCSESPDAEVFRYASECSVRIRKECAGQAEPARSECRAAIKAECYAHIEKLCETSFP